VEIYLLPNFDEISQSMAEIKLIPVSDKMLSYRRETALQGALQFSPKVEDWNWGQYFTDIIGLSSTTVMKSA